MKKIDKFVLKFLASLSMAGALLGIIVALISIVYPHGLHLVAKIPGYANIKLVTDDALWIYPYVKVLLYIVSFLGAYELFWMKRRGFWLYVTAQVALLVLPYFTWNKMPMLIFVMDLPDLYFSFAFIGAYALYYRHLSSTAGNVK